MSANNYLLITKKDKKYILTESDFETGIDDRRHIYTGTDLLTVCKAAKEYMQNNEVEYGTHFEI